MQISQKLLVLSLTGFFLIVSVLYFQLQDNVKPVISQDLHDQNESEKRSGALTEVESENQTGTDISNLIHSEPAFLSGESKAEYNQALSFPVVAKQPAEATSVVASQFVTEASISRQESSKVARKSHTPAIADNIESSPTAFSAITAGEVDPDAYPEAVLLLKQLTQIAVQSTAALVRGLEIAKEGHMQAMQDQETKY